MRIALLIDPRRCRARDFRPGRAARTLGETAAIDFAEALPGFVWRLDALFALLRLSR
ncbi:MAG TPA: hypothetical protein VFE37_26505 [Chloroflexota bacterium]|nr:hypothetical protein [Chloroflexota bacterium]